jgi:hypothetical protein
MSWKKQSRSHYRRPLAHVKASLQNVSILLVLIALLAACSQVAEKNQPEPGLADPTPGQLVFIHTQEAVQELTLRNDNDVPIEINEASIIGDDVRAFSLIDTPDFPLILGRHQQINLKVRFEPHLQQDTFQAALRVTGGKPEHAAVEVAMYGEIKPATGVSHAEDDEGWTSLFNGQDLDGWYTWLPSTGKNNDPNGVFKAENGMLHILDVPVTGRKQEFGYIATSETYKNYHLRFEYKWGTKRFKPRDASKRDSGLLYHVVGPDRVWPRSVELQIQEGDTGDFWLLDGTTTTTTVVSAKAGTPKYREDGEPFTTEPGSFVRLAKSHANDKKTDWNYVEVIVTENEATHIVNGHVNNWGQDFRQPDPDGMTRNVPLNEGRILFQAEGAEVFYRNIEIRSLD